MDAMEREAAPSAASKRFGAAFDEVLANDLDRRIMVELLRARREVRYEELRKAVGVTANQTFRYAIDRLMAIAVINRRLVAQGKRYQSHLSPTKRGRLIAEILEGLGSRGAIPDSVPLEIRLTVQRSFVGKSAGARPKEETFDEPEMTANPLE